MTTYRDLLIIACLLPRITRRQHERLYQALAAIPDQHDLTVDDGAAFVSQTTQTDYRAEYCAAQARFEALPDRVVTIFDALYPPQLAEIYEPPLVLFCRGNLNLLTLPAVAIVGTRQPTAYGEHVIDQLLPAIAQRRIAVVSGLARGVDMLAHRCVLRHAGPAIAVIGNGLDHSYPIQSQSVQSQVGEQGLIVTEYPHGTPPRRHHFPARNRIIAGLASVTVVIEAQRQSGSLITANSALQNNREVLAVPGNITSPASAGTNDLIAAGAQVVTHARDIVANVQIYPKV